MTNPALAEAEKARDAAKREHWYAEQNCQTTLFNLRAAELAVRQAKDRISDQLRTAGWND